MVIETKFDLHQTVWFMRDNKAESAMVKEIQLFRTSEFRKDGYTLYTVGWMNDHGGFQEAKFDENQDLLFATKQELLDSL